MPNAQYHAKGIGRKIGCFGGYISRAASGSTSLPLLEKIAGVLGVEVSELFAAPKEGVIHCPHCGKLIKVEKGE